MAVLDDAKHKGGFTLFGKNFGNYNQDIKFRVFYEKNDVPPSRRNGVFLVFPSISFTLPISSTTTYTQKIR